MLVGGGIIDNLPLLINWESFGFEIIAKSADPAEALRVFKELTPDILFVTTEMAEMDGLEFSRQVRLYSSYVKIVFISANKNFEYARKALTLGVSNYFLDHEINESNILNELFRLRDSIISDHRQFALLRRGTARDILDVGDGAGENESEYTKRVLQTFQFIRKNYYRDIALQDVTAIVECSSIYLSKLIKKETGTTFLKILTNYRVEKAKELLLYSNCKIYEIAEKVGYKSSHYFSQTFKEITGVNPHNFRQSKPL